MPLLAINATPAGGLEGTAGLSAALAALPPEAPVIVMVHGYKYAPGDPVHCPHGLIFAMEPAPGRRRATSWPRRLGVGRGGAEPLCIAFGWPARGSIWSAWKQSAAAAAGLADLVARVARHPAGRPVRIVAHSLGARVALRAMQLAAPGDIGRMILLSAAAMQTEAQAAISGPGGQGAEVINVTSRENDLFDATLELVLPGRGMALGAGLGRRDARWLDIEIDNAAARLALADLGFRIDGLPMRICHWSSYLRPGLFGLYRALLSDPAVLPLNRLRRALPGEAHPRWSRLWPRRAAAMPTPA